MTKGILQKMKAANDMENPFRRMKGGETSITIINDGKSIDNTLKVDYIAQ